MKSLTQSLSTPFLYLLVLITQVGFSQDMCFFAKDTVGCAPFKIEIHDCGKKVKDNGQPVPTFYSFDNGASITQDTTFTFPTAGIYNIWQFKGFNTTDTLIKKAYITVLDNPKPLFTLAACADFVIHIKIDNNNYDRYIISYEHTFQNDTILGNTSIQKQFSNNIPVNISIKGIYNEAECFNSLSKTITPIKEIITPTIDSLINTTTTNSNLYFVQYPYHLYNFFSSENNSSFISEKEVDDKNSHHEWSNSTSKTIYIKASDVCGNFKLSDSLSTISLEGTAENTVNKLNWTTLISTPLTINRNNEVLNSATSNYSDIAINCGEVYNYYISQQHNTSIIKSNTISLTAISTNTPQPLQDFYASIINNKLTFNWSNQSVKTLHLYDENLTLKTSLKANGKQTVVSDFLPNSNQCFYANYTDICNNKSNNSDTIKTCNSVLKHQVTSTNNFTWTPYFSSTNINTYIIEWLNHEGELITSLDLGTSLEHTSDLIFKDAQNYSVRVKVELNNNSIAYTNSINIEQDAIIKFPTAFSPNGDDLNDTFKPVTLFIKDYSMTIFSLNNEILYEGTEWEGNTNEHKFSYIVKYTDQNGNTNQTTGSGILMK